MRPPVSVSGVLKTRRNVISFELETRECIRGCDGSVGGLRLSHTHQRETSMAQAKHGDTVRVHYHGTLEDGTVFSSTYEEQEPFEFTIGKESVLPLFEEAVIGLNEGESVTISIQPKDGYGEHKQEFVFAMDRKQAPEDLRLEVGKRLQIRSNEGRTAIATITAITDDTVVLDANDPLAGRTLNFKIELLQIV